MEKTAISLVLLVALSLGLIACGARPTPPQTYTPPPSTTQPETPTPTPSPTTPGPSPSEPLSYPWDGMNMFFGWSIIGKEKIPYVKDLDMKWASLQPFLQAVSTASAREATLSLLKTAAKWLCTVRCEMNSLSAISLLPRPLPASFSTSSSLCPRDGPLGE